MVRLNRIYTRTGDDGTTGLGDGERRQKFDARVGAYGEVDELNSAIGVARAATHDPGNADLMKIDAALARAQNDLFDLGADLCFPPKEGEGEALRVTMAQVAALEREIDALNADLSPLKSFVLPGGTRGGGGAALGASDLPASRARDRRARGERGGGRAGHRLHQPSFRLSLRRRALREPSRRRRHPVGSRREPLTKKDLSHDFISVSRRP